MLVTTKIGIELQRPSYPAVINAVQGDQNTRQLEISLYSGSVAWQVPKNATAAMRYQKPDKTKGYYDTMPDGSSAFTVSGNTVSILLAPQMLTVPGTVDAQVVLFLGAEILSTFVMQIHVEADPSAGVMESENYTNWAQWIEAELDKYLEKVKVNGEFLGGSVVGPLNMNGNPIGGLANPSAADQAVNLDFVNQQMRKTVPRNLLDNSNFRNPVNQRGQTSYAEAAGYTIDRWRKTSALTVEVISTGIKLSCTATLSSYGFSQYFENPPVSGTALTMAIMRTNGMIHVGAVSMPSADYVTAFSTEAGVTGRVYTDRCTIMVPAGESIDIAWVVLYEGTYTSESLPDYKARSYGEELAECMRYYWRLGTIPGMGYTYSSSTAYAIFISPVIMRAKPKMVMSEDLTLTIRGGGKKFSATGTGMGENQYMSDQYHRFSIPIGDSGLTADENVIIMKSAGTLEFVADINP